MPDNAYGQWRTMEMDSTLICLSNIALNLSQLTQFLCELHPNKAKPSQEKTRLEKNVDNAAPCRGRHLAAVFPGISEQVAR